VSLACQGKDLLVKAELPQEVLLRRGDVLRVIGGGAKGGLLVREGQDMSSHELASRLSTGAVVQALAFEAGRVCYKLLSGAGPASGWVSTVYQGKSLLANCVELHDTDGDRIEFVREPGGIAEYCNGELVLPHVQQLLVDVQCGLCDDGEASFILPVGQRKQAWATLEVLFAGSSSVLSFVDTGKDAGSEGTTEEPGASLADVDSGDSDWSEDGVVNSDGEDLLLCRHCHLPLGDNAVRCGDGEGLLHAECVAEYALQGLQRSENARERADEVLKRRIRADYDMGWQPERAPRGGEYGLVLCGQKLELAATCDPAAAVNLEYLALALQVRRAKGVDARFSLDPIGQGPMQAKRFEPAWLAGTSAGEVLFQADIYLKELSMGEHPQPVVGMRSCLDMCEGEEEEERSAAAWSAREWFVVSKAEVRRSPNGLLMPHAELAVEAREQRPGPSGGMEDVPVTRPDHPLVKFAEDFSRNFALIAERKSVIFHLRELARATCLAKFLLDARVPLHEAWFEPLQRTPSKAQVPQVWRTSVRGVVHEDGEVNAVTRTVSGGVDLSMDRFALDHAGPSDTREPRRRCDVSAIGGSVQFRRTRHRTSARQPCAVPVRSSAVRALRT